MVGERIDNFAAVLNRYMSDPCLQQKFVIRLTIPDCEKDAERIYMKWIELKKLCDYSIWLSCCLNLTSSDYFSSDFLLRFFSEKMFAIQLQQDCFITNNKGFPVLPN